jgi:hypothetical protein
MSRIWSRASRDKRYLPTDGRVCLYLSPDVRHSRLTWLGSLGRRKNLPQASNLLVTWQFTPRLEIDVRGSRGGHYLRI